MNALMIIASLVLLSVPILYLVKTMRGSITPNPITFGVRSVVSIMNLATYFFTTGKDPFKSSVTLASTIGLIMIFVYSFKKGKFSRINQFDVASGIIACGVALLWKLSEDPIVANLCLQSAMLIAFIPAIKGVLIGGAREQALPWAIATLAYILMTVALVCDPGITWQQLIHPVFVGILGNGGLMLAAAYKNSKNAHISS